MGIVGGILQIWVKVNHHPSDNGTSHSGYGRKSTSTAHAFCGGLALGRSFLRWPNLSACQLMHIYLFATPSFVRYVRADQRDDDTRYSSHFLTTFQTVRGHYCTCTQLHICPFARREHVLVIGRTCIGYGVKVPKPCTSLVPEMMSPQMEPPAWCSEIPLYIPRDNKPTEHNAGGHFKDTTAGR